MTVKELENRTGMTRANIRFYEGEGLLSPKRLPNGYRDYSEEDVRTLEKIQLLRRLQLDIDTIRRLQDGTLTLEQALFVQATKLEGDKAVIERAAQVCRELERTGVEYAVLEPDYWLERLKVPERTALPELLPASEEKRDLEPRACYCPWQRLFARAMDMTLYSTLIDLAYLLTTRDLRVIQVQTDALIGFLWGLMILFLTLALEPLWLHFWGWTPGKWVFGLRLRDEDSDKLTLAQCWERSWRVFQDGYGCGIPVLEQWKMWNCREMGLDGRDCWWDAEEDYRYIKVERRVHGGWICAAVEVLSCGVLILTGLWSTLPPCRGDLTVADFSRNYNHYRDLFYSSERYGRLPAMDEEGHWEEEANSWSAEVLIDGVWYNEEEIRTKWDQPEYALDYGRVTAVTLHMTSRDFTVTGGLRESLAFLAMSGAVKGLDTFNYDLTGWGKAADQMFQPWEDIELDYRGLHISQQVEYKGYEKVGGYGTIWQIEGEERHCEKTVTISLIE